MASYSVIEEENNKLEDHAVLNTKYQILTSRKKYLEAQAEEQIKVWKDALDGILKSVRSKLDDAFKPFEQVFIEEREVFKGAQKEGSE